MQPDGVKIWHFKSRLFEQTKFIVRTIKGLQYLGVNCKDIGIRKSEFPNDIFPMTPVSRSGHRFCEQTKFLVNDSVVQIN